MRFPIIGYIVLMIVHFLFGIFYGAVWKLFFRFQFQLQCINTQLYKCIVQAAVFYLGDHDQNIDHETKELLFPAYFFLCAIAFMILIPFIYVYAKLASFIKDREEVGRVPGPFPKYVEHPTLQSNREFL
ncbi:hypothetical protein PMAYCL1PPCAC_05669, partial [Pristionchus mayeri]